MSKKIRFVINILICSILGIIFILPFFWMLTTSLMSTEQIVKYPPEFIPSPFTFRSFEYIIETGNFLVYFRNSVIITLLNVLGTLISTTLVAYGFAKYDAPLKKIWFALLMSTMMIPYFVTIIPLYNIYVNFKLINTFVPLVLPNLLAGSAFSIFLLHQFFKTFPDEIENAARIDGCGEFNILFKIVVPNSRSVLFVVAIFMFVWTWSDYFGPVIFLNDQSKYTLAVGLVFLTSSISGYKDAIDQGPIMAMSLLTVLPIIVVYSFFQKYFIAGITNSGLKG